MDLLDSARSRVIVSSRRPLICMMPSIPGFAALRAPHPFSPARRGGAKQIEAQRPAAFRAFSVQGLTGAGLPTALYEKSPAQSAELQFVCGERGTLFWRFLFSNLFIIRYLKFQKITFWTVFDPILTRLAESKVLSANYLGHYSRS